VAVDLLGERRDLFPGEGARGVAGHLRHLVDRRVVGGARADHLAPDVAEPRLVLPGPDRLLHLGVAEALREDAVGDAEVLEMPLDAATQTVGDVRRERGRHRVGGGVADAGRVGGERLGGCDLGGGIGETLGVDLVVVDALAPVRQAAARGQRRVERGAGRVDDAADRVGHASI
jgi:hypothetical protein